MQEFLQGALIFLGYIFVFGTIIFGLRAIIKIPDELFRKILHFLLLGAYLPILFGFQTWWKPLILVAGLIVVFFPILYFLAKIPGFTAFVYERKNGEFKDSMVLALSVILVSVAIGWGILGDKYLVLASVYAWGIGDAFAALIGKKYGKHKIKWKLADNKKSVEGTLAMLISSTISVTAVLLVRGGITPIPCFLIAIVASTASTLMELCTKNGYDTITCPAVSMLIITPLLLAFGG